LITIGSHEDKATDQDKHEVRISNEDKALDDG
jgi:hypothetical protein